MDSQNKKKTTYIPLCADPFHHGHLKLIEKGRELGELTVGILTDEAIASYKRKTFLPFESRKKIVENIKGVKEVIPQHSRELVENIKKLKPDYVVHGDDWKTGFLNQTRNKTLEALNEYGGQLIELPYTKGVSSTQFHELLNTEKSKNLDDKQGKTVYIPLRADLIHHGHLNIIQEGRKYGDIIIGLLTDKAIAGYRRPPLLSYEERKIIAENLKGVKEVIPQDSHELEDNIRKLKPDFVVHGDNWKTGFLQPTRRRTVQALKEYGGNLIEVPFTKGISSTKMQEKLREVGTTPEIRMKQLKRLLELKPLSRFLEAHNGLTGLIVENTKIVKQGLPKEFDGIWVSSLTDLTAKGKPDIEFVDFTSRLSTIHQILDVTTKPIIVDGDTGGLIEHFPYTVKTLERLGISAIIIEDKIGLKQNSLFGTDVKQIQDAPENFAKKISVGKKSQVTEDFMIIARIESLILKKGLQDALDRTKKYIEAGTDGIMIHSKDDDPSEILDFCQEYKKFEQRVPLVVVPTTYCQITERELQDAGVNVVIYANQLLRSAYPSMLKAAENILFYERAYETDNVCMPIKDILGLLPNRPEETS